MLADKGINVSRKILSQDIALLNDSGYEILSYKKKYYYYYVVNRPFDTAEIVMLSDDLFCNFSLVFALFRN